jgi:hypothetical protein
MWRGGIGFVLASQCGFGGSRLRVFVWLVSSLGNLAACTID